MTDLVAYGAKVILPQSGRVGRAGGGNKWVTVDGEKVPKKRTWKFIDSIDEIHRSIPSVLHRRNQISIWWIRFIRLCVELRTDNFPLFASGNGKSPPPNQLYGDIVRICWGRHDDGNTSWRNYYFLNKQFTDCLGTANICLLRGSVDVVWRRAKGERGNAVTARLAAISLWFRIKFPHVSRCRSANEARLIQGGWIHWHDNRITKQTCGED